MTDALADVNKLERTLREALPEMKLTAGAEMARYTTFRLGGPADLLAEPGSADEAARTLAMAREAGVPVTVIGNGSNLLVLDGGIRGLTVRIGRAMSALTFSGTELTAEAGAMMGSVAAQAAARGLAGLVFAGGIPGTVGGGVYMNAGAYGGEMSQVVARVEGVRLSGEPVCYTGAEMGFGYRHSRLMSEQAVVTRVVFSLTPGDGEALRREMSELNRRRAEKQPLDLPNAGSAFKRPVGGYASALIDQCGLRGARVGGAQVSEKHTGFIVNRGGTAADVMALIAHVQRVVLEKTGVALEPELRILGEAAPARAV